MNRNFDEDLQLVGEAEASRILGLTPSALQGRRWKRQAPAFIKVGRLIRYRISDLKAFLDGNTQQPERA